MKEHKVECYFEKENIWTFDSKGELLLTIMSSLAQEESRSISANVTWGQRKRFADGKVTVPFKRFLGYDRGEDGNLVINEGQAAVVRRIYGMFLQGHSLPAIARRLTAEGIPTPGGKTSWSKTTIKSILTNEKYKGDALLQKVYTVDFLSKKKKVNEGEIPQYYVEHSRDAIIDPRVFDQAQRQMAAWQGKTNRHSSAGIFADRIRCGDCGSRYGQKVWHSNDKYRRVVGQRSHKFDGGVKCGTPHLDEAAMKERFVKAVNLLTAEREEIYGNFKEIEEQIFGMRELEARQLRLQEECQVMEELARRREGKGYVSSKECQRRDRQEGLWQRLQERREQLGQVRERIGERMVKREGMERFLSEVKGQKDVVTEFDEGQWYSLVDVVTVFSMEDMCFTFKDGTRICV